VAVSCSAAGFEPPPIHATAQPYETL